MLLDRRLCFSGLLWRKYGADQGKSGKSEIEKKQTQHSGKIHV